MDVFGKVMGDQKKFNDPFLVPSSNYIPDSLDSALDFCIFLYYLNPQYRRASQRVVSHFITKVTFDGKDGDARERKDLEEYIRDGLDLFGAFGSMGEEWAAMGNSFWRINFPFDRLLVDRRSGKTREYSLTIFGNSATFDLNTLTYEVPDPVNPESRVALPFLDRKSMDPSRIRLCPMEARLMSIRHSFIDGSSEFVYRFNKQFEADIRAGKMHQVNRTPVSMLKAIAANQDYLFHENEVYHFKAPTIAGVSNNGWGVPETLLNYRSIHQLQVYRKIDEQVGLDYMLPFRLFSPTDTSSEIGHGLQLDAGEWTHHIRELIRSRRRNPENIHAFPFAVNYQEFGAEGKSLTPKELIEFQTNDMLDGMGYPAELFRGTLRVEQIPTALRLFENSFHFIHRGLDRFTRWAIHRIQDYLGREQIGVSLELPSIADDLEERNVYMQLAAGGELSRATAYRNYSVKDPVEEIKKRIQEDIAIEKERSKLHADFEREATMGDAENIVDGQMAGGAPAGGEGGMTPVDRLMQEAEAEAARLLQIPDNGTRSKELNAMRASKPELHAAVKQKMEELRSQGASEGRKQIAQMV
jgi:hypothetical protein